MLCVDFTFGGARNGAWAACGGHGAWESSAGGKNCSCQDAEFPTFEDFELADDGSAQVSVDASSVKGRRPVFV